MANQDGKPIEIVEDDMGEGFKELWEDYKETIRPGENPLFEKLSGKNGENLEEISCPHYERIMHADNDSNYEFCGWCGKALDLDKE